MKTSVFLLLAVCFLAGCRKPSKPDARAPDAVPVRKSIAAPPAAIPNRPLPLLKTPRITVTINGSNFHEVIATPEEADALLADVRELPQSAVRDRVIAGIIGGLAKVDPAAARQRLEDWDGALISEWLGAARSIARILAKSDPESGAEFIGTTVPAAARASVWPQFLAEIPPAARETYFGRIPESNSKLRMAADLALVWVAADPAACAAWMDRFAAGRNSYELQTLGNPQTYPPDRDRTSEPWLAAFHAAETPEARRIFATEAWQAADPAMRAKLFAELRETLPKLEETEWKSAVENDPAGYAAALNAEQIAGFSSDDMRTLIGGWAEKSPQAAIEWALKHDRPEAAAGLMQLHFLEPETALSVARELPPGAERDKAISDLCQRLAFEKNQADARSLLPLISSDVTRERIREWIIRD